MKNALIISALTLFSSMAFAEKVAFIPYDCGPLSREDYGVVFSVLNEDKKQVYFSKGQAMEVCTKLLTGNRITGYEKMLPQNPTLFSENERKVIKEFVVTSYGSE